MIYVADNHRHTSTELLHEVHDLITSISHLDESQIRILPYSNQPHPNWNRPLLSRQQGIQAPVQYGQYQDSLVKRFAYDSEDEFESNMYQYTEGVSPILDRIKWLSEKKNSILLNPFSTRNPSIKHLLVLYERIYYPISFNAATSISDKQLLEIISLSELGIVIPLLIHPLYTYPSSFLHQIFEHPNARYLLPRQLDELILSWSFSEQLPWTSYRRDYNLSQRMMNEIRRQELQYYMEPGFDAVIHAVKEDMKFQHQMARCAEEEVWNHSFSRFGLVAPGSTMVHLMTDRQLELMSTVHSLMFASALRSSLTPSDLVNHNVFSIISNIGYGNITRPFRSIQPLQDLERVLTGLEIVAPDNVDILEWVQIVHDLGIQSIQNAVNYCLTDTSGRERLITQVDDHIRQFNDQVRKLKERRTFGEMVEEFDIMSLITGYAASALGMSPTESWMLNHVAKGFITGITLKQVNGISLDDILYRLRFMSDVNRGVVNVLKLRESIQQLGSDNLES